MAMALHALVGVGVIVFAVPLHAQWQGKLSVRGRVFGTAASNRQFAGHETEAILTGSYHGNWDAGRQGFDFEPFLRVDPAGECTRFDLKELSWEYRRNRWDARVGFQEIFWGVVEGVHLVDVINQRDIVVDGIGYVKLGQPLVGVTSRQSWGAIELILMPYFRERTFTGRAGTLWSPVPVAAEDPQYQASARNWQLDGALRWSYSQGAWDFGVTQFAGTNRDPRFVPAADSTGQPTLVPYYDLVNQTALDVQWTRGSWLWKLETTTLDPAPGRYLAAVCGVEYAVADYLSIYGEYAYDSRGYEATTSFNDDVVAGVQLLLQEGRARTGVYFDRRTWNTILSFLAERRLSDSLVLTLEMGAFVGRDSLEPPYARRQHDYLSLNVMRYF